MVATFSIFLLQYESTEWMIECTGTIVSGINNKSLIEPTIIEIDINCTSIPLPESVLHKVVANGQQHSPIPVRSGRCFEYTFMFTVNGWTRIIFDVALWYASNIVKGSMIMVTHNHIGPLNQRKEIFARNHVRCDSSMKRRLLPWFSMKRVINYIRSMAKIKLKGNKGWIM